ncbi:MAG TPA: DUF6364 family protein [Bryobacteraceae bacterium]
MHEPYYTDPVKQSLTLTLDRDLLRAARKVAFERDTSVNQMIRDYLVQAVHDSARRKAAVAGLDEVFRKPMIALGPITWKRNDLHER